jgi:GBP family porin
VKRIFTLVAATGLFVAHAAQAQSSVTLYGLIDAGVMYTNNVVKGATHGSLLQADSGGINGSRFGVRGSEDLGGGLKAIFVLESGFSVQNGKEAQDNRLFGRQAFVGLSSDQYGTVTLGRQYDTLVDFLSPLSATAGTFGDTGFAHPFDNDNLNHSVRMNNAVKYTTIDYAGFKAGALYALSNSTDFAVNRAYSVGASYNNGPIKIAAGYLQIDGSNSTVNTGGAIDLAESSANGTGGFQLGADRQRVFGGGVNYAFGPASMGLVYTRSEFTDSTSFGSAHGTVNFDNYEVNGKYALTPAMNFGLAYVYTDAHVDNNGSVADDPKWSQVDAQAVYSFSKRTDVYLEGIYQRAIGQGVVAFINGSGGASSSGSQVVTMVGMRTRF